MTLQQKMHWYFYEWKIASELQKKTFKTFKKCVYNGIVLCHKTICFKQYHNHNHNHNSDCTTCTH